MEDVTCGLSELEIAEKGRQFKKFWEKILAMNGLEYVKENSKPAVIDEDEDDTKDEIKLRDYYEAKVPEADLETVQLRYIPDYIRELKTKEEYWKKEFNYWGDLISKKNWKLYEKKVKYEMMRNKTVLKNLDKHTVYLCPEVDEKHFSLSLDPERVQRLVDYIMEKESEDNNMRFSDLNRASIYTSDYIKSLYIDYAIFARYGDFRGRPSRLNLLRAAEEKTKKLTSKLD